MKILFVSESYWPNQDGGAIFERRLVHQLVAKGFKVSVWAPGNKLSDYTENDGRSHIYREKSIRFIFNWRYRVSYFPFFRAGELLEEIEPDLVHIHNPGFMGLAMLFAARRAKVPIVATNHFMPENAVMNLKLPRFMKQWLARLAERYLVWFHKRCDTVTSPTPTGAGLLKQAGLSKPVIPITNGVDTRIFHPGDKDHELMKRYGIDQGRKTILYLGRIDGEKRVDDIIQAVYYLKKHHQKPLLVIAGRGKKLKSLVRLVEKQDMHDQVIFTGFIPDKDKPKLYRSVDVFTIASPAELQSIVLLEAMSSGLPVVAVDVAALKELCRDGQNGYLFELDDIYGYAKALEYILTDQKLRQKFGKMSRQIVETEHTQEISLQKYVKLYEQTAGTDKS